MKTFFCFGCNKKYTTNKFEIFEKNGLIEIDLDCDCKKINNKPKKMTQNRFQSYIAWFGTICTLLNSYISHNNLEIFGISENTSKIVVWVLGFIGILASFNNPEKKGEL